MSIVVARDITEAPVVYTGNIFVEEGGVAGEVGIVDDKLAALPAKVEPGRVAYDRVESRVVGASPDAPVVFVDVKLGFKYGAAWLFKVVDELSEGTTLTALELNAVDLIGLSVFIDSDIGVFVDEVGIVKFVTE